jgi:hypothetical protein
VILPLIPRPHPLILLRPLPILLLRLLTLAFPLLPHQIQLQPLPLLIPLLELVPFHQLPALHLSPVLRPSPGHQALLLPHPFRVRRKSMLTIL